jgi:hypothetical protein
VRTLWLCLLVACVAVAGCASGPKKRVFPPEVRLQELQRLDDGTVQVQLRLHNYSNVPMRFERLAAELMIGGVSAGRLDLTPSLQVSANSVEIVATELIPPQSVLGAIDDALASGSALGYQVRGKLATLEPRGNYSIDFSSRMDRVPGLDRVLR